MGRTAFRSIAALLISAALLIPASVAEAAFTTAGEVGDTRASATSLNSFFDLTDDYNIFDPTTVRHASVYSANNATTDVDWYSFTGVAGAVVYLDIDCAYGFICGVPNFDPTLALFDGTGTLLAWGDNSDPEDLGTYYTLDSFIGAFTLPSTGTYYVAVSNYDRFPVARASCTSSAALTRPDGAVTGGFAVTGCTPGSDGFSGGSYSGGTYTLHISHSQALVTPVQPGPNQGEQIRDYPKYRWVQQSSFAAERVAPADYASAPGSCHMRILNDYECTDLFLQPGCHMTIYDFLPPPPNPPGSGFECCGWQGKCELTCAANSCSAAQSGLCPEPCPGGAPDSPTHYCWNSTLVLCQPGSNQAACDQEEQRLRGLGVPDCCFVRNGVHVIRWGTRLNEAPAYSLDTDLYPDQCDNCPQLANDQADTDGDQRGNACDSFPNHRYQCADVDADHCDDCVSGGFDPAQDQSPCLNPLPEPHAVPGLGAGAILLMGLARWQRGRRNGGDSDRSLLARARRLVTRRASYVPRVS
jgi:hypothetical protein